MVDNIISVAIGGIIAAIPTLISAIHESKKYSKTLQHEISIKKFELYEKERILALNNYLHHLGSLNSRSLSDEFGLDKYFAASEKASCFVTEPIRKLIFECNGIASHWQDGFDREKFQDYQLKITSAIYSQYMSDFYHVDDLTSK